MDVDGLLLEHLVIETNDADSLDALLACALARICEYTGYPIGHAYLVASDQDEIIPTAVWHGPREDQYRAFHDCSCSLQLGLGECLPGRALAAREPVQSPDIREEASFVRRHEAIHAGLRSGFAIPVLSGSQAVATLEFYSPHVGALEDRSLRLTAVAGVLLGRAVERQKARMELRKRGAQLDQAETLAALGSWEWTIGTDEMTWSEQLYRIYDVPRARFDGTFAGHLQRTAPADRERIQGILEQAIDDRQPFEFRERPGAGRVLLTRGEVVLDAAGLPIRAIGVCQDITYIEEARRREVELEWEKAARQYAEDKADELQRLTRELERSNQELDQFAYVASHDLKAPLRGIANLSEWLEEDLGDKLNAENLEHLELLRGRVHRMESLIDGLLAYSRVSRKYIAPEVVDMHRLLDEIIDLLVPPEDVVFDIDPHLPSLTTPRIPLHQVFHNLIGNALKHAARTDGLRVEIRARDAGLFYNFSIADDGPGIAPEYHQRIWQIFQTLQPRDKVEGAGMGLALVKKIVEHHGGTVGIESQPRAGATFHFRWPKSAG